MPRRTPEAVVSAQAPDVGGKPKPPGRVERSGRPRGARAAAKGTQAGVQPCLLLTIGRPSDAQQLPAWAARVRQRLVVVDRQIRRLEREKQTLLGQLFDAPDDLVAQVLEQSEPLSSCSRPSASRPSKAVDVHMSVEPAPDVERVDAASISLWEASGGHSAAALRKCCGGKVLHPSLVELSGKTTSEASAASRALLERPVVVEGCQGMLDSDVVANVVAIAATPSPVRAASNNARRSDAVPTIARCRGSSLPTVAAVCQATAAPAAAVAAASTQPARPSATEVTTEHAAVASTPLRRQSSHCSLLQSPPHANVEDGQLLLGMQVGDSSGSRGAEQERPMARSPSIASTVMVSSDEASEDEEAAPAVAPLPSISPAERPSSPAVSRSAWPALQGSPEHERLLLVQTSPQPRSRSASPGLTPAVDCLQEHFPPGQTSPQPRSRSASPALPAVAPSSPSASVALEGAPRSPEVAPPSFDDAPLDLLPRSPEVALPSFDDDDAPLDLLCRKVSNAGAQRCESTLVDVGKPRSQDASVARCMTLTPSFRRGPLLDRIKRRQSQRSSGGDAMVDYMVDATESASSASLVTAQDFGLAPAATSSSSSTMLVAPMLESSRSAMDGLACLTAALGRCARPSSSSSSSKPVETVAAAANTLVSTTIPPLGGQRRLRPDAMDIDDLRQWCRFFGMKPSTGRDFMVRKLKEIDAYLNGPGTAAAAGPEQLPPPRLRGTKRQRDPQPDSPGLALVQAEESPQLLVEPDSNISKKGSVVGAQPPLMPKPPRRKLQPAPSSPGEKAAAKAERHAAKTADLERLIASAIRADKDLYERLLLFEPVELTELRERLVVARPELRGRLGEQRLRNFLDAQGILFSSAWRENVRDGADGSGDVDGGDGADATPKAKSARKKQRVARR